MRPIRLLGLGRCLPARRVSAEEVAERLGTTAAWVLESTGVAERRFVVEETAASLGAGAARDALRAAGLDAADVDLIVSASGTLQQPIPCTASLISQALGDAFRGIPCFDLNATCLSFLTALDVVASLIADGRYRRVLIVSADVASAGIDWTDKESAALLGDGAAAAVIGPSGDHGSALLAAQMRTFADGADLATLPGGGSKLPPRLEGFDVQDFLFHMDGRALFKLALQHVPTIFQQVLDDAGLQPSDLALVIPHQASRAAMRLVERRLLGLGLPEGRFHSALHAFGNVIAASIPLALHHALDEGRVQRGDRILLLGTSAGFSVGAAILEY